MVEEARGSATISFDPNCRPNLVKDKARYVERMAAFAAAADIVRMSDVDFEYLYGDSDYAGRAKSMLDARRKPRRHYARHQGRAGLARQSRALEVEAPTVDVVDTIGAGDSFQAALLFALHAIGRIGPASLAQINADELRRVLSFAAPARPSPAAGPAPIRRGHPRSARNCRVSWLVRRARRSVLLRRGQARIKAKRMLNPLCHTKHPVIVSVSADDLEAERKAVLAEPDRKRRGGYAKECPWRAILGVAGILQSARRFAERGQCQQRIVAGHLACESVLARFLHRLG